MLILIVLSLVFNQAFSQDCNITSKANDILPDQLCAPVSLTWEVTYRGVNDGGTLIQIQYDWDDGNPVEIYNAVNTSVPLKEWKYTANHTYPQGGNQCVYNPSATLMVNGVLCTSTIQEQSVTVWDVDTENGGQISINPAVFPICVGDDGTVTFNDVSLFNCVPPVENDNPNTPTRWTQWEYGTNLTIANVLVNTLPRLYPFSDVVYAHTGPVTGPTAPNISTLPIYSPNTALVGQFFEVRLNYWNICNPYEIAGVPTGNPPVFTTAQIQIVAKPDATITPAGPFCQYDPSVNLSAATGGGTWSGTGIINAATGRFRPSSAGPGTHTITYSVTNGDGCTDIDTEDIVVWASPQPNMLPGTNLEVCPGNDLFLDGNPTAGTGAITTHLWTGDTGPLNNVNIQNPTFNTVAQGVYNLTYRVTDDNGCTRTQAVAVTVNPVSTSILPDPAEVCAGANLNMNGNPSGGTGNYVTHFWSGDTAPLDDVNTQTPVFSTVTLGAYNLTYTVTDDNGCTSNDNITVTVFENPVADAGLGDSICGNSFTLGATASIGIGTWTQTSGSGTATFVNDNLPNTSVSVDVYGDYELTWTEVNGPGCTDAATITIVFLESPVSNAGADKDTCSLSYFLKAIPSVGVGEWTQTGGPGTAVFANPNLATTEVTVDLFGSYQLTWVEDNGFGCTDNDEVTVNFDVVPTPLFTPGDTSGCPPFNLNFTNNTVGGATYEWDFGDGNSATLVNPSHTFINPHTYDSTYTVELIATSTFGCKDTITHDVTVYPVPVSSFSPLVVNGCNPVTTTFINNSTGSALHYWNYGDGTPNDTVDDGTHTFVNNSTVNVLYLVRLMAVSNFGCVDTSDALGFVTVFPTPDYVITVNPDSVCHDNSIEFTVSPQGSSSYEWDFGDGATVNTGPVSVVSHNFKNLTTTDTTFTVSVIGTTFGCKDTSEVDVVILPEPKAAFKLETMEGCSPYNLMIENLSLEATKYYWDFGDDSTSTAATDTVYHLYTNTSGGQLFHLLKLEVENAYGCKDDTSTFVTVNPEIDAAFVIDTIGCSTYISSINNTSSGANSYYWDFGDGGNSTSVQPVFHSYVNTSKIDTVFTVKLFINSEFFCVDSMVKDITVHPLPIADFKLDKTQGCTPLDIEIVNLSEDAVIYEWDFDNDSISNSSEDTIDFIFYNNSSTPDALEIKLKVWNVYGCFADMTNSLVVYPEVRAAFIPDTIKDCSTVDVNFENQSFGAETYKWNFGDSHTPATEEHPNHSFTNETIDDVAYSIELVAFSEYNCKDTAYGEAVVYPQPIAVFTVDPEEQEFPNSTVTLVNESNAGNWFYLWDFGDDSTLTDKDPGDHTYIKWNNANEKYEITLKVYSEDCIDQASQSVKITSTIPIALFDTTATGCPPLEVQFTNQSLYADEYEWDFGDGNVSNLKDPSHFYNEPGTYTVRLEAKGAGGKDVFKLDSIITVYQGARAFFKAVPKLVYIPDEPVQCTNLSENAAVYNWDFGDGEQSTAENPIHIYKEEGEYEVVLEVWTKDDCYDKYILPTAVTAEVGGELKFPNAFVPSTSGPSGGRIDPNDPDNVKKVSIFYPATEGVEEYHLQVFNRWGELVFESFDKMIGWDGYYRDKPAKQDVYVWKVTGKYSNGKNFTKSGDVTLLK